MAAVVGKLLRNDLVKTQLCHRSQKVYFPCVNKLRNILF